MAEPYSTEWDQDWNRLTLKERPSLQCQYDGPIPHQSITDTITSRKDDPKIKIIIQILGAKN